MTSRRTFLKTIPAAAAATLGVQPAAASPDVYSPYLAGARGLVLFRPGDAAATYRGGDFYGWHIQYDPADRDLLDQWIEDHDVDVLSDPADGEETGVIAISAAIRDVAPGLRDMDSGDALVHRDYVQSIDLVQQADLIEPIHPRSEDAADTDLGWVTEFRLASRGASPGAIDSGLAFNEDMPGVDIGTVREQTNAIPESFGGALPDTSNLTVAVIDTGVNKGPIFDDDAGTTRIVDASKNVITGETGVQAVADGNSHGTWCASAIAGDSSEDRLTGYAPKADILAIKALSDDGSGSTAKIVEAVQYAADQDADAICMSLGSPVESNALSHAISYAVGAGSAVYIAVGNDRFSGDGWINSPADAPDAYGVAATTGQQPSEQRVAYFSSRGPDPGSTDFSGGDTAGALPQLAAPGCRITVQAPKYGEIERSGTSMATPVVTGAALQLMAHDSSLRGDPEALYKRLQYTAQTPYGGVTEVGEHGVLDVQAALDETDPEESQTETRNATARDRDRAHHALSDAEGGWIMGL